MVTVRAKLRLSSATATVGRIVYQVIHRRVSRRVTSGLLLPVREWDEKGQYTANVMADRKITSDLRELRGIADRLESSGKEYTVDDICRIFRDNRSGGDILKFMENEIGIKVKAGKAGTARTYRSSLNSFRRFVQDSGMGVAEITASVIDGYQSWLVAKGICTNSISFYMRTLRAVYRRMVKMGLASDTFPFDDVHTGIGKTRKRAILESDMRSISRLDLRDRPGMEFARDMFLLSFYMLGISYVDLCLLKKSDCRDTAIVYRRAKTGQTITIGMNPKIRKMLDKYPAPEDSEYLLPIIKPNGKDERLQYESAMRKANKNLKKVGNLAGLMSALTTYTARHTWASIAKLKQIELSTISDALGHQNESTTRIYLATLNTGHIDRANDIIIKGI